MGMSTHVYGFRAPDEKWSQMKDIFDACKAAGVDPPEGVWSFFDGESPDDAGVQVDLGDAVSEFRSDYQEGVEVSVPDLPEGLTSIRFVNSY
jgi:hypothetical protein